MRDNRSSSPGYDLRSYGRRRGRKLSPHQDALLRDLLPRMAIPLNLPPPPNAAALSRALPAVAWSKDGTASTTPLEPLPPNSPPEVWLEIGFGGAEHLLWQAERNFEVLILGCEPFEEGVVKALSGIEQRKLVNVRIHPDDARPLLRWLPAASLSRVFILFPDPWPKRRHQKRRLLSKPLLDLLARAMRPGAELRFATDIGDYVRSALLAITAHPSFAWQAASPRDWRERPEDWPGTRYEAKAVREGRNRYFFKIKRV